MVGLKHINQIINWSKKILILKLTRKPIRVLEKFAKGWYNIFVYQRDKTEFGAVEMDKYNELKEKFEANRNDENAIKMAAYMRNLFLFYGLPTPKRKSIYKDFLKTKK